MPQPALHILLATAALEHWRQSPDYAPFACDDANNAHAFLHGALGPDIGLFPGGDLTISNIAHYGRTGVLLRSLMHHAGTDAERAFAWGWLTHILADVAVHPLVNRAVAESAGDEPTLVDHVRVEVGLDAHFAWQHTVLRCLRMRRVFEAQEYSFVARALYETHAYPVSAGHLDRMQASIVQFSNLALRFATTHARPLCWETATAAGHAWRNALALAPRTSLVRAYLVPEEPQPWLIAAVEIEMRRFVDVVDHHVCTGLQELPDFDLETGLVLDGGILQVA